MNRTIFLALSKSVLDSIAEIRHASKKHRSAWARTRPVLRNVILPASDITINKAIEAITKPSSHIKASNQPRVTATDM